MGSYKIIEIFDSIEGEGARQGLAASFVRLAGCNLRCSYCDTTYAYLDAEYQILTTDEILSAVNKGFGRVTLTGGEPLIAPNVFELIELMSRNGFEVNIETNGAVSISEYIGIENVFFTIDYKLPSSGVNDKMLWRNFEILRGFDVIKLVVGSKEDISCMLDVVKKLSDIYKIGEMPRIFIGAVYGEIENSRLVETILQEPLLKDARLQLQIHKIIWNPNKRSC